MPQKTKTIIKAWAVIMPKCPIKKGGLFMGPNYQKLRIYRTKKIAKLSYPDDFKVVPIEIKILCQRKKRK